jgi:hypothetical protein
MEDIIDLLREKNEPVPVPLDLPDEDDLVIIQEQILIHLPYEYKIFLLTVSDVICGSLEPATVADPHSHTYLPDMAATAWDIGLPRYLIPVCTDHDGNYYCIAQDGEVSLWTHDYDEETAPTWPSIWQWAHEVWLES